MQPSPTNAAHATEPDDGNPTRDDYARADTMLAPGSAYREQSELTHFPGYQTAVLAPAEALAKLAQALRDARIYPTTTVVGYGQGRIVVRHSMGLKTLRPITPGQYDSYSSHTPAAIEGELHIQTLPDADLLEAARSPESAAHARIRAFMGPRTNADWITARCAEIAYDRYIMSAEEMDRISG